MDDKERFGAQKKVEDEELEALLHEDECQVQAELAESLGVDDTTGLKCLKALEIIQNQGYWVLYELKPRDVKRSLFTWEQLLQQQKRKVFLHRIMTDNEKWIQYDNPKHRRSWSKPSHA